MSDDNYSSVYLKKTTGNEYRLTIRHTLTGKGILQQERHNVELSHTSWDVDGNATVITSYSVFTVKRGGDPAAAAAVIVGLNTFVSANATALAGWDN